MEERKGNAWKTAFFVLLGLILLAGVNGAAFWYFVVRDQETPLKLNPSPSASPMVNSTPESILKTPSVPVLKTDDEALLKEAVFTKTGLDETSAEIKITKNTGQHAFGTIREIDAVGGAWWIAAKTTTGWVCVHDGQSNPSCSVIAPYDFPTDMVPECLDASGNVVSR